MMTHAFWRSIYRRLLGLHPRAFQARFGDEMMWIFDEFAPREGVLRLFGDALLSLLRQWTVSYAPVAEVGSPRSSQELFAWDRIAYPTTILPIARMLQGRFVSFTLVASFSRSWR